MITFILLSWYVVAWITAVLQRPTGPSVREDLDGLMAVLEATGGILPFARQQDNMVQSGSRGQRWCGNEPSDFKAPFTTACTVPVVVYGWNRPNYFARVLGKLREINDHVLSLPSWPDKQVNALEVFVSLDGPHLGMMTTLLEYAEGIEDQQQSGMMDSHNPFGGQFSAERLKASLLRKNAAAREGTSTGSTTTTTTDGGGGRVERPLPVRRLLINPIPSSHLGEAKSLEPLKRHWHWMMRQVFSAVPELAHNAGPVLFLEDDMNLPLEAMHVFRWLSGLLTSPACHDCWGGALSVGGFSEGPDPQSKPQVAYIKAGHSNSAYFFNRTTWGKMASDAAKAHYDWFPDGWDWVMAHFTHVGVIPPRAVVPALSRVHNFGVMGLTVTEHEYERLGLGNNPHSEEDAPTFLARAEAGKLRAVDVPAGDDSSEQGRGNLFLGPRVFGRSPEGTSERCPICREDGTYKTVPRYVHELGRQ